MIFFLINRPCLHRLRGAYVLARQHGRTQKSAAAGSDGYNLALEGLAGMINAKHGGT